MPAHNKHVRKNPEPPRLQLVKDKCVHRLTATDFTALMSFLLSRFFRILFISVRGRLLLKRISLLQIPADTSDCRHHCTFSMWTNQKQLRTFVSCVLNDLINQLLLIVRTFHLTATEKRFSHTDDSSLHYPCGPVHSPGACRVLQSVQKT